MFCSVCFELRGIHLSFPRYTCSLAQMKQRHLPEDGFKRGNHPGAPGPSAQETIVFLLSRDWSKHIASLHMFSRAVSLLLAFLLLDSLSLHLFSPSNTELRAMTLINPSPTYTLFSFEQ